MEEARVLVRFGGTWKTSANGQYAYNGGRLRGMKVVKGIAYNGFVEELYKTIEVDANEYGLKMEVLWHSSSMPLPPMEICNGSDLCFFLDGVGGSANDFIPLCVTLVRKDSTLHGSRSPVHQISNCHTHYVSGSGSNQIVSTKPSRNEPELETTVTFKEQFPMSQPQMSPPPLSQQPTLVNNDTQGFNMSTQNSLLCKRKSLEEEINQYSQFAKKILIESSHPSTTPVGNNQLQSPLDESNEPIHVDTPCSSLLRNAPNESFGTGRSKSVVWLHFKKVKVDGKDKAECNYCHRQLVSGAKNGTKHLHDHHKICPRRKYQDMEQKMLVWTEKKIQK